MARLRNTRTGTTIRVPDAKAVRLGPEWVPVGAATQAAPTAPRGNASREQWAAYADSLGVTYPEDAGQRDIRAAVMAAV